MARSPRTAIHDIAERLRNSDVPEYRTAKVLGFHHGCESYPVLLSDPMFEGGMWVLGATRSGKTQRVLASLILQDILLDLRPTVVLDLKGDDVLYKTVLDAARCKGGKVMFVTNVPWFPTHLFNPWAQKQLQRMSLNAVAEMSLTALNLNHGFGYGRFHFTGHSSEGFSGAYLHVDSASGWGSAGTPTRAQSFVHLLKRLPTVLKSRPELKGADSLQTVLRRLARVYTLNSGCCPLYPADAVAGQVQIADLLDRDSTGRYPVLYCYLRAESEPLTAAIIAKLIINWLKNALRQRMDDIQGGLLPGPLPLVSTYIDECQYVLDASLQNLLEQGASMGFRFVLANQDPSQLVKDDKDYFRTVWENTAMKAILSARDNNFQELLMKLSGEKSMSNIAYMLTVDDYKAGRIGPEYSVDGFVKVQIAAGPRFERNHLIEMSANTGRAIFMPPQNEPLARYDGYPILIDLPFLYSKDDFERLKQSPWPAATPDMVIPQDYMERWEAFLAKELP